MAQEFFLNTNATKKGLYLSQQQIDLLFIVSCESKNQLEEYFYKMCGQFPYQKIENVIDQYEYLDIEEAKKELFVKYQEILIDYMENHRMSKIQQATHKIEMMRTPEGLPIPDEIKDKTKEELVSKGEPAALTYLSNQYGKEFILKFNRLMKDDFENIKSISYEDIVELNKRIKNDQTIDTIIIATSKYNNAMYTDGKKQYYDPFLTAKGLAYCKTNKKHMRFHAIFDNAHIQKLLELGKGPQDKEEILSDIKKYIEASFEYIEKYNNNVNDSNEPTIQVVEIFNELVEYNKTNNTPYEVSWEKYFGITIDDILSCFDGIQKPKNVQFMYNETLLEEHPDRRRKVSEVFTEIMKKRPDLIDVFGNQMHLQHTHAEEQTTNPNQSILAVKSSLDLMKAIEDASFLMHDGTYKKVKTEITEFDIHITKDTYINKVIPLLQKGELSPTDIKLLKKSWMEKISEAIKESGVNVDRITYWSIHDTVDHNLVRANKSILDNNPNKTIEELENEGKLIDNLYAGAIGQKATLLKLKHPTVESKQDLTAKIKQTKEKTKTLTYKPPTLPNSGFTTEYIIICIILLVLITLVALAISVII